MSIRINQELNNIKNSIKTESERAIGIETGIISGINTEPIRANDASFDIITDLNTESSRAQGIESGLQTEINNIKPLVGSNNIFSMIKTTMDTPNSFNLYSRFDNIIKTSPYINYISPDINNGGPNTGCICQANGYYKIEYVFNALNLSFPDRVCWYTRIMINNISIGQRSFIYTRANNDMYVQHGSAGSSIIHYCNQNDYIQLLTLVAKNSKYFNDDFVGLRGDIGTYIIITYLGL